MSDTTETATTSSWPMVRLRGWVRPGSGHGAPSSVAGESPVDYGTGPTTVETASAAPITSVPAVATPEDLRCQDRAGLLDELDDLLERLGRVDTRDLRNRELLEHTVALDRRVTQLQAELGRFLYRVDHRMAYREDGCASTAGWLRLRTNRDHTDASRLARTAVRVGRFLRGTQDALRTATISWRHAEVIASAAIPRRLRAILDHEDTLVALAGKAQPRDVRAACQRIADVVDPDHSDAKDCGPDERRTVYATRTFQGFGDLRANLDPVTAELLDGLLHAFSTPDPAETEDDERRSPAQVRHDAFDAILRAASEHPDIPSVQGAKPHVLVMIDLMTLLGRDDLATRKPRLGSGSELSVGRAVRLLEEGRFTPVLMWGPYRGLAFGRTQRVIPDWLRPLLKAIHVHCRGPGCDRPFEWTQAMHIDGNYVDGATTEFDHTVPGCDPHHDLVDHAGWTVGYDPDTGICTWTSPDRKTVIHTHPPDP